MKVVPVLQSCLFVTESFLFLLLPKHFFFFFLQCCFVKRRGKSAVHSGEWQVIKQKFRFCQPRRKGGRGEKERKRNKFLLLPIFIQVSFSIWLTRNQHRHEPSQVLISTKKKDFMMRSPLLPRAVSHFSDTGFTPVKPVVTGNSNENDPLPLCLRAAAWTKPAAGAVTTILCGSVVKAALSIW